MNSQVPRSWAVKIEQWERGVDFMCYFHQQSKCRQFIFRTTSPPRSIYRGFMQAWVYESCKGTSWALLYSFGGWAGTTRIFRLCLFVHFHMLAFFVIEREIAVAQLHRNAKGGVCSRTLSIRLFCLAIKTEAEIDCNTTSREIVSIIWARIRQH